MSRPIAKIGEALRSSYETKGKVGWKKRGKEEMIGEKGRKVHEKKQRLRKWYGKYLQLI